MLQNDPEQALPVADIITIGNRSHVAMGWSMNSLSELIDLVFCGQCTSGYQQKQRSLWTHNAPVRTSYRRPMSPLRPGRPGVLCLSCLGSGASCRPFHLPQLPCVLVAAHSVPAPSAALTFRLPRLAYSYQRPHWVPPSPLRHFQRPGSVC